MNVVAISDAQGFAAAAHRRQVHLNDGRIGTLTWWPDRRDTGSGGPAPSRRARVVISGRHFRIPVEEIAGVLDATELLRPPHEKEDDPC